jgi:hypothetical protein
MCPLPFTVGLVEPIELVLEPSSESIDSRCNVAMSSASSCPIQLSQKNQPTKVAIVPQVTTATGDSLPWYIPAYAQMYIATEQTC